MQAITRIFPDHAAEFHIGLRNPATYLPELHRRQRGRDYDDFIGEADPGDLRWSDLIVNLIEKNPQADICVWADEDTPLIWPEVLRAVSGHSADLALEGSDDLLESLMTAEGMRRMRVYMASHPRRRLRSAAAWFRPFWTSSPCPNSWISAFPCRAGPQKWWPP